MSLTIVLTEAQRNVVAHPEVFRIYSNQQVGLAGLLLDGPSPYLLTDNGAPYFGLPLSAVYDETAQAYRPEHVWYISQYDQLSSDFFDSCPKIEGAVFWTAPPEEE